MTVTPHGYPDWQRQSSIADVWLLDDINATVPASGQITRGPFFVGTFRAIGATLTVGSGRYSITFEYWRDQAMTIRQGEVGIRISADGLFAGAVPVYGPWMREIVDNETAVDATINQTMWLQQYVGIRNNDAARNQLAIVTPQNIAAGATLTISVANVSPGAASLSYRTTAVANSINLQSLTSTGTWATFFSRGNQLVLDPSIVFLPAGPMRMQCVNNDAGARAFEAYLLGDQHFMRQ